MKDVILKLKKRYASSIRNFCLKYFSKPSPTYAIAFSLCLVLAYQNCAQPMQATVLPSETNDALAPDEPLPPDDPPPDNRTPLRLKSFQSGGEHTCGLKKSGTVTCWGNNTFGQLGNNSTTDSSTPVAVLGISDAMQVASGAYQSCAVLTTGEVKCWGTNSRGQLGNNTTTNSLTPVSVVGIANAQQVVLGHDHSCAALASGVVKCWGSNSTGQLGSGAILQSSIPVSSSLSGQGSNLVAGYESTSVIQNGLPKQVGRNSFYVTTPEFVFERN
jgi:alpha-tubulin suppressor-like RCC1 family protein